jgi:hypothetical protein
MIPYKLVSVNKIPERAKILVGRVCTEVKDQFEIIHCGNAESELFSQASSHISARG